MVGFLGASGQALGEHSVHAGVDEGDGAGVGRAGGPAGGLGRAAGGSGEAVAQDRPRGRLIDAERESWDD